MTCIVTQERETDIRDPGTTVSFTCFQHESIEDKSFRRMLRPRLVRVVHRSQHVDRVEFKQLSSVGAADGIRETTQEIPRLTTAMQTHTLLLIQHYHHHKHLCVLSTL